MGKAAEGVRRGEPVAEYVDRSVYRGSQDASVSSRFGLPLT
ncbi:hypothetical protein FHS23_001216 [Prauserella isguenensis]|uniref:Uncharacterized protein n=1 Tax=Prauserella isguenensis TaxID=1470180 RepID=A0A839RWU1_9PSEU|nr:hypothetical protein [Prauserella isguenensis]MBB3050221.1 hypothetical protein [Prauserella isguenensis]